MCTTASLRAQKAYRERKKRKGAGSGNVDIKSLSPKEQLNYEVASEMLKKREYRYDSHSLKSMREAAEKLNEEFVLSDLEFYGVGGKIAIEAYAKQLESDYAKEYKKWNEIIREAEKSIPKTATKKYDEIVAKERARKRRKRLEKDNSVKR